MEQVVLLHQCTAMLTSGSRIIDTIYLQMQRIKQQIHEIASIQAISTIMPMPKGLNKNATTSHSVRKIEQKKNKKK